MLASFPVSMLNQKPSDLGIPNRFKLDPSRSRANFLAHLAARDAAEADLLFALVGAHAVVDAAERRTRASFAMPSLVGTRQGLRELLSALRSSLAAYDTIRNAATPLFDCVRHVLSSDDRYRHEALFGLLDAYRRSLAGLSPNAKHDIDAACEAIEQRSDNEFAITQFAKALVGQMSLIAPLVLFDAHPALPNDEVDRSVARARLLLADRMWRT